MEPNQRSQPSIDRSLTENPAPSLICAVAFPPLMHRTREMWSALFIFIIIIIIEGDDGLSRNEDAENGVTAPTVERDSQRTDRLRASKRVEDHNII